MSISGAYSSGNVAPGVFGSSTSEQEVMNILFFITELALSVPHPISSIHIVFCIYDIMPNQPEPNFDF
jgi:hypothetical protein